ncbi:MAG: envelope biogenesis factor ElyC [Pyrinomonadaceae bacterium]
MFLIKKLFGALLFPVPLCLALFAVGLFLLWFTRWQRIGKAITTTGVLFFAILAFDLLPGALLWPLERQYPAFDVAFAEVAPREELARHVKWIVVLGGGNVSDPEIPMTSQLASTSLARVVEGVRLKREFPQAKLLLSGARVFDPVAVAEAMSKVAQSLGVDQREIVLDLVARDTEEEAAVIKSMVGDDRFIMVTSASHMPRAMALFIKQGMQPIPAPTEHVFKRNQGASPADYAPGSGGIYKAERATYEYLGLLWAKLRGRI